MERNQAATQRRDRNLSPRPCFELFHAASDVRLHRATGHVQLVGYLLVAEAVRDQARDLKLPPA